MSWCHSFPKAVRARALQSSGVGLAGADAHGAVDAVDEDLDLGQEADGVFGAAIDFGVALLAPVSLDLGDGHSERPARGQGFAHLVNLERLDDSHDDLHGFPPLKPVPGVAGSGTKM